MRDASVTAGDRDFLAPAGGVSPGIHAEQGIHPVTPGAVSATAATQQAAEYADMAAWQPGVKSLAVTPATKTLSLAGTKTQQLTATATLIDGTTTRDATADAAWSSSDTAKATVSAAGLVTAVAAGTATITGTYRGKSGTSAITVTA